MSASAMIHHQRQVAASGRPYAYGDQVHDENASTNMNSSSNDAGSFMLSEDVCCSRLSLVLRRYSC